MKIAYLPYQPHCFAFGGFDLQMLSTFNECKKNGLNVEKLDVWGRDTDFDILHCWGLGLANYENVYWGKKANKKIVCTALLGYYENNYEKLRYLYSSIFYKAKIIREMIADIDGVVVVNETQAEVCFKYFKVPSKKISVIPHVVNDKYFIYRDQQLQAPANKGYILSVGNVCKRKNQVNLAKSCLEVDVPLVIIGKILDGEENYAKELNDIITKTDNIKWISGLKENSDLLLDYFAGCLAVALPSFNEQQPISLLEAAIMNKPLIIADKSYARQKYYANSQLVNPASINSIKNGLINVLKEPLKYCAEYKVLLDCKGENVAKAYKKVYENILY